MGIAKKFIGTSTFMNLLFFVIAFFQLLDSISKDRTWSWVPGMLLVYFLAMGIWGDAAIKALMEVSGGSGKAN